MMYGNYYGYPWEPPGYSPTRAEMHPTAYGAGGTLHAVDPYVVQSLHSVMGRTLVVNTGIDRIRGQLILVRPDHIVLREGDSTFFIRIQKITWIMPD